VRLIRATVTTPAQITRPTPVQAQLLKFLGVDPAHPPWRLDQLAMCELRG